MSFPLTPTFTKSIVWVLFSFYFLLLFSFSFLSFFICFFRASPAAYGSSQARGQSRSCGCLPMPQLQQCQIWATSVTYTEACSNARSLTHWMRAGIEPVSSWILVGFLTSRSIMGKVPIFIFCFPSLRKRKGKKKKKKKKKGGNIQSMQPHSCRKVIYNVGIICSIYFTSTGVLN